MVVAGQSASDAVTSEMPAAIVAACLLICMAPPWARQHITRVLVCGFRCDEFLGCPLDKRYSMISTVTDCGLPVALPVLVSAALTVMVASPA